MSREENRAKLLERRAKDAELEFAPAADGFEDAATTLAKHEMGVALYTAIDTVYYTLMKPLYEMNRAKSRGGPSKTCLHVIQARESLNSAMYEALKEGLIPQKVKYRSAFIDAFLAKKEAEKPKDQ